MWTERRSDANEPFLIFSPWCPSDRVQHRLVWLFRRYDSYFNKWHFFLLSIVLSPFQLPFTFINPLSLPSLMFFQAHCFQFLCRRWLPCSPLAPLGPIFPGDPAGPWSPLRPLSPCGPTDPLSPGGPAGPWSPLAPSLPLSPGTPGTPGTPLVEVLMTVGHWRVTYKLMI